MRVYILGEHLRQRNRRYTISEIELGSPQVIEEANEAVVRRTWREKEEMKPEVGPCRPFLRSLACSLSNMGSH